MTGLHFLVIGAAKSGTTTLFELLRQHPQLYLPPGKEDPFFSRATSFENGWDAYVRRSFAAAPAASLCGTATPEYMAGTVYEHGGNPRTRPTPTWSCPSASTPCSRTSS
jgi:hypothetical protein